MDALLDQLGRLGAEESRTSSTKDVTEDVADIGSRVASMQASIARIRAILARADKIGDVVSVESELSSRTTELESLQARQRALAGQVDYATVTLELRATPIAAAVPPVERGGFVGGLQDGWHAFTAAVGVVLTALGALLPFLAIAIPVAFAVRARVAPAGYRAAECTSSTTRVSTAGSVSGRHAVAEVEDVAGGRATLGQHAADLASRRTGQSASSSAGSRLPCTARCRPDPAGRLVERDPPVDADHVRAGLAHQPEQLTGADPEVHRRHVQVGERGEHRGAVRLDEAGVVGRGQRAGPRVEQLQRGRAGPGLHPQERGRDRGAAAPAAPTTPRARRA